MKWLIVSLALFGAVSLPAAEKSNPHVVLILLDDMGFGDPGCYNAQSRIETPNLDRLAREGLRFTDMHASGPLCHVSRFGLMTGMYPFRGESHKWAQKATIPANQRTLPGMLRGRGYHTAMVGKWHLGFNEAEGYTKPLRGGPVDRGFEIFFGIRASTDIPPYFYIRGNHAVQPPTVPIAASASEGWSPIQGAFWREGLIAPDLKLEEVLPRFTEEALKVIHHHDTMPGDKKPLFLYLAYPAPHTPWLPSPEFRGRSKAGMYGDFASMVDAEVGKVLAALEATKMLDETLLLLSSDNGPVWYEADVERLGHDAAGPWRGMKADAWEAGHRMPFIARWPGHVKSGTESGQMLSFVDVMATLAELTGAELGAHDAPDSFSFFKVLTGQQPESEPVRQSLLLESGGGTMMLRQGNWKYLDRLGSGGFSEPRKVKPEPGGPEGQLYDLAADPGEQTNLWLTDPERVEQMRKQLSRLVAMPGTRPQP
ncbi:MAG: arylsulfatase [Verrucomicrobiales bacterium]|nr:arylsulfatase [Verrucomicrobiales bacterium]